MSESNTLFNNINYNNKNNNDKEEMVEPKTPTTSSSSGGSTDAPTVTENTTEKNNNESTKNDVDVVKEDDENIKFEQAKTLYRAGSYSEASDLFSQVLDIKVNKYGDLGFECGDTYYYYGKSLLELTKSEGPLLGDLVEKKKKGKEDSDDETDDENNNDNVNDNDNEIDIEKQEEKDDDLPPIEIAWEVLEVARLIYEKHMPDTFKQLVDVYQTLGDHCLETEQLEGAVENYKSAIKLLENKTPVNERMIAEGHFKLGVCYQIFNQPKESLNSFLYCKKILENVLLDLESKLKDNGSEVQKLTQEMSDLKEVVADLDGKIEEVTDVPEQTNTAPDNAPPNFTPPNPFILPTYETGPTLVLPKIPNSTPPPFVLPSFPFSTPSSSSSSESKPVLNLGVFGKASKAHNTAFSNSNSSTTSLPTPFVFTPFTKSEKTKEVEKNEKSEDSEITSKAEAVEKVVEAPKRKLDDIMSGAPKESVNGTTSLPTPFVFTPFIKLDKTAKNKEVEKSKKDEKSEDSKITAKTEAVEKVFEAPKRKLDDIMSRVSSEENKKDRESDTNENFEESELKKKKPFEN